MPTLPASPSSSSSSPAPYEQGDIVQVFYTGRIGETAVKFSDGWIFYSTAGKWQ